MPGITRPRSFNRSIPKQPTGGEVGPPLQALTAEARRRFAASPVGSVDRKAAGALEVSLATTRSVAAARRVLEEHRLPDDVRQAALELLDELDTGTTADAVA